ncbi:hypothetical protein ACN2WE_39745 [Streptomyces sp. cg28]|uniref:hypothetical protein n=1 Tax=Streptomyces sp. cg28 TaxID=3403457 RepID=UPI003B22756E
MNPPDRERLEDGAPGAVAVVIVLAPVLFGIAAVIFLVTGYGLKLLDFHPGFADTLVTGGWVWGLLTAASILVAAVSLLRVALKSSPNPLGQSVADLVPPDSRAGLRVLGVASSLAGRRREHLRAEWTAILAGDPSRGLVLSRRRRMQYALGFLWAAVRMRAHDVMSPCWRPVDWLLRVERRTNVLIGLLVGGQAIYIVGDGGLPALVTEIWEPCGILGGALYVLARWLRRIRGIELATARPEDTPSNP